MRHISTANYDRYYSHKKTSHHKLGILAMHIVANREQ